MSDFRQVNLPEAKGAIYLHAMPGRFEPYTQFEELARLYAIDSVVCLTPMDEVEHLSPHYYRAIERGTTPFNVHAFTIANYRAPEDWRAFAAFAKTIANAIMQGESVLMHCAAGIGRTGMMATSVLILLGIAREEAAIRVRIAGASPERAIQQDVIDWLDEQMSK